MFAEVLIEYNSKKIDKSFTYKIPSKLIDILEIGMKVIVPFNNRYINGFVIKIINDVSLDYKIKEIIDIKDKKLKLDKEMLELGFYISEKTLCSKIQAFQTMLPSSLKIKYNKINYQKYNEYIQLCDDIDIYKFKKENKRAKKQIEIIENLIQNKRALKENNNATKSLISKGVIKVIKEEKYRININKEVSFDKKLTNDQLKIFASVKNSFSTFNTFLLNGVTGSGKTEIYMALINELLSNKKTALVLVPEISLTTQIVERFYNTFGNKVAIYHSGLSEGEKYDEYLKILNGDVSIVIGTRSAIFVPLKNLGIIIVDEEHSENYKQDNTPKYNAIDIALKRCEYNKCPLLLGSATPSLESMARAIKGKYKLLKLDKRIGNAKLPSINLVDMQEEYRKRNMIFSDLLIDKINFCLQNNNQAIILLNRRGYSTIVNCSSCGYTYKCPDCEISLTYHKSTNNLRCHYCGYSIKKENTCPKCHEDALNFYGLGTEKLEIEIKKKFPNAKVVRMDTDTTSKKNSLKNIIEAFKNKEYDILVGTQMISKGFDFDNVTLVGVINADASLNIPDFRSNERTFSLLSQVAGRAGRKNKTGEVILQTFDVNNQTLNYVKENNYYQFFQNEMKIRHALNYPPYYFLVNLKIISKDYAVASINANKTVKFLKEYLKEEIILGPTTASMFKLNNKFHFQIIVKYKKEDKLMPVLKKLDNIFININNCDLDIDINPLRI